MGVLVLMVLALLEVFLEPRGDRETVDQVQPDVSQDGEFAEMLQGVHAPEPRERVQEPDGGRRLARPPRPQVVEALAPSRRQHGILDELDDRNSTAVRSRLRIEAEHP